MRFQLLGPLEVTEDDRGLPLAGPKQRLVLAHLLLRANEVVATEQLIDEIWGDAPPDAARASLQSYVSHLRKALGPDRLIGRAPGYLLRAADEEVDAVRFETLVARARRLREGDPAAAVRLLRDALTLWRGEPLADLSAELSLQGEIARLNEMRLAALEERIDIDLELGGHGELVAELERLTARHPLRERLSGQLMLALYRSGRQGDALAVYHRLRQALDAELGVEPSPLVERLQHQILTHDRALEVAGEPLRGYRLLETIGSGTRGTVHRALEPQSDRQVAIRTFPARIANDPDFVRRFDADVQRVARLEHPNALPIYDWWREPDAAYVVMRLMPDGNLADRIRTGQLSASAVMHWAEQLGSALAAAHRRGIVHGALRASNVLLDEDGNAYLADFVVGHDAAAEDSSLAPERRAGGEPSPAADIYSLAVLLRELLVPLDAVGADHVLRPALSKDPFRRPRSATELVAPLRAALLAPDGTRVRDVPRTPRNPYKGLRAFEEADATDFVGRENLVEQLVRRLAEEVPGSRLLAVVGPSGSGKSSLVRAGLVPALRAGALLGSDGWLIAAMTPGSQPFDSLERALLSVAVDASSSVAETLTDEDGLSMALSRLLPPGAELLLVIDQFEELETLTDEATRRRFLAVLAAAVDDPSSRLRLLITLRADFYDRPLRDERFGRHLAARTYAVAPMTPEGLARAVREPAERAGLELDEGLVARIVSEMSGGAGALPLLQYALAELWERRDGARLSLQAFEATGGIAAAIARRADELIQELAPDARETARQIFLRLVELGEGVPDSARRVRLAELHALGHRDRIEAVVERFARYRLLLFDRDPDSREPTVQLAHEALLRAWPRLQQWVDDARDDVRSQRLLAAAAAEWIAAGRDVSFLLTGSRLTQAEQWAASTRIVLGPAERELVDASLAERAAREAQDMERRAHEAALERQAVSRLRSLVVALGAGALVAAGLSLFALGESQRAAREARLASARELAAAALANLEFDPERSIYLALAAVDETRSADGSVLREAEEALHRAVVASRAVLTVPNEGGYLDWTMTPDGRSIFVTAGPEESGLVTIRDTETGTAVLPQIQAHRIDVNDVAFSGDGSMLATAGDDGALRVWSTTTGELMWEVDAGMEAEVWGPSFGGDHAPEKVAGAWFTEDVVRVLDLKTGVTSTIDAPGAPRRTAFSPDGTRLAVAFLEAEPAGATIFDVASLREVIVLEGHRAGLFDVDWSPDGRWIATASIDTTARVWEADSGATHLTLFGHSTNVLGVVWGGDSGHLLTGSADGTARLWELADAGYRELLAFSSHDQSGGIEGVAFSPDATRVMTGDATARVAKIWDVGIAGDAEWMNLPAAEAAFNGLAVTPDGRLVASRDGGAVTIWDAETGTELLTTQPSENGALFIEASPDSELIASASPVDEEVAVWRATTGDLAFTVPAEPEGVGDLAWSAEGDHLAVSAFKGRQVTVVDRSGDAVGEVEVEDGYGVQALAFGAQGRLAAAVVPSGRVDPTDNQVIVWDWVTGERIKTFHPEFFGGFMSFAPDSSRLATTHYGLTEIWDLESDARVRLVGHAGLVWDVTFSPDGRLVATAGDDGTVRIWDTDHGGLRLVLRGHTERVFSVQFLADGSRLASISADGTLRVWAVDLDDLIAIAQRKLTRELTAVECREYLRLAECP